MTDLRADGLAALEWAASYLERVGELPVLAQVAPGEIRSRLPERAPEQGEPFAAVLRDLDEILLPGITHWQHPRYFAYFATGASEPGIVAELLAATLNSIAILWRTAPAATELEGVVLDWAADLLGLPAGWHGHIEDSASTSTTPSTSVDPVPAIAEACERDGAWLHVDAAYAGNAMVCPEHRWAFAGVERADSVVVVCFRCRGEDAANRELLERVNASGEIFISHAVLDGSYVLRLAVGGCGARRSMYGSPGTCCGARPRPSP